MHYRNGREAKNGDKVAKLDDKGTITAVGTLQNAVPGNDYCNGQILITGESQYGAAILIGACMCDCLHLNDIASMLKEVGLDKRPPGK